MEKYTEDAEILYRGLLWSYLLKQVQIKWLQQQAKQHFVIFRVLLQIEIIKSLGKAALCICTIN